MRTGVYDSYWSKTETYEALLSYINLDQLGLQADIIQMIGGNEMPVDTSTFQNDMTSARNRDDVLSLLIHLGYLAYYEKTGKARIPNEEIRREFVSTVRISDHEATTRLIKNSDQLIEDTINGNEEKVAQALEDAHAAGTFGSAPLFYHDEQALRAVVKFAYISCANGAIHKIHDRNNPKVFENIKGEVILCGINYGPESKQHECKIERMAFPRKE